MVTGIAVQICSCDWLNSMLAALAGSRDADFMFGSVLLGEEKISLLQAQNLPHSWFFSCCLLYLLGGSGYFFSGLSEEASVPLSTGSSSVKHK